MLVIVAGSRLYKNYDEVCNAIEQSGFDITRLVTGRATGVDFLGERWARANKIPISPFPANWSKHGKAAGPIRNREMAEFLIENSEEYGGCGLVAVWSSASHRGTDDMIKVAFDLGIPTYVHQVGD